MDNDDKMIGKLLSRRSALKLLGLGGATLGAGVLGSSLVACNTTDAGTGTGLPGCVVRPALTEGPYFVDEKLNRSDIRSSTPSGIVKAGVPLVLNFVVSKVGTSCVALSGVQVDVWHCDAGGLYSDESANNTVGQNFLRGYQLTDANGKAVFTTVYPGWYSGRAVHIHFKLRVLSGSSLTKEFTSQLFFNETTTDLVHATAAYSARGTRTTLNANDNIYKNGGSQLLLTLAGDATAGYAATFDVGLNIA
jgi:protocatechuate 3,4-dioxygenase beta subunit